VSGLIRFYDSHSHNNGSGSVGERMYLVLLPGAPVAYDAIDKSDIKEFIIPFVTKCAAFKQAYKGNYGLDKGKFERRDDIIEFINLYNKVCK
jgi:hypothetical protein